MMRLDKMLAHCGYGSRKEVKEYIRKGLVLVNGEIVYDDDLRINEEEDEVVIADTGVEYEKLVYLMLNKPAGYISATYDKYDPIVLDLVDGYEKRNLFPIGRLDKDTEGLLLLTNDGKLAHRVLSPKNHINKVYYLKYEGQFKKEYYAKLQNGIVLEDGYQCMPAKFIELGEGEGEIIIQEGKFHQVKRMMEALNCRVTYLKRIQIGELKLDSCLKKGSYKILEKQEIERIFKES